MVKFHLKCQRPSDRLLTLKRSSGTLLWLIYKYKFNFLPLLLGGIVAATVHCPLTFSEACWQQVGLRRRREWHHSSNGPSASSGLNAHRWPPSFTHTAQRRAFYSPWLHLISAKPKPVMVEPCWVTWLICVCMCPRVSMWEFQSAHLRQNNTRDPHADELRLCLPFGLFKASFGCDQTRLFLKKRPQ